MSSFISRTMIGLLLTGGVLFVLFMPPIFLFLFTLLVTSLAIEEISHVVLKHRSASGLFFLELVNAYVMVTVFLHRWTYLKIGLLIFFLLRLIIFTFSSSWSGRLPARELFVLLYITGLGSFLLRFAGEYQLYLLLAFFAVWGTDTFAYLSGMLFGRTPLVPTISPKKTVEGALGGMVGAVLFSMCFREIAYPALSYIQVIVFVIVTSIFSQLGDLFASSLKRASGVKDFSLLLREHGGIIDRFDSIFFGVPAMYILLVLSGLMH